jgi:hypothetical protein
MTYFVTCQDRPWVVQPVHETCPFQPSGWHYSHLAGAWKHRHWRWGGVMTTAEVTFNA